MTQRATALTTASLALVAAAMVVVLSRRVGSQAVGVPLALVLTVLLVTRPVIAVTLAVGSVIVIESDPGWGPSAFPARIYQYVPGSRVTGVEALVIISLIAAMLYARARDQPLLLPRPFSGPLLTLGLGLVAGAITGHEAGVGAHDIIDAGRTAVPVVVVPFIAVQVFERRESARRILGVAGALAGFKGVAGLVALAAGLTTVAVGSQPITYYDAPANAVMMGFMAFTCAAAAMRVRLPLWVWLAVVPVAGSLVLSYRRSFWIATVLAMALVALLGTGRNARRIGLPALAVLALGVYLAAGSGLVGQLDTQSTNPSSLSGRLRSLDPSSLASNTEDRYRLDERRNVLAELRGTPIAGLGLGVGWIARYPLSLGDITRQYVHMGALWWWMKLGILGLIGYVWLLATMIVAGFRIWRRHPDPLIRASGLAAIGTTIGFAVAELTATFAGADLRMSVILGMFVGYLAIVSRQLPRGPATASSGAS